MKIISWDEFNSCVKSITSSSKGENFSGVYGIPRGGLCLSVALSHSLGIPLLTQIKKGCLVVDDVYETGRSLSQVLNTPEVTAFVWFSKVKPKWWHAVELAKPDEWLIFPWENKDNAAKDMKDYQLSRIKN
ncbi:MULTISPECIES: phosphoribosyltransferase [Prochlorococcus]|uniref:phosphoribosyltransferase n=1 Tax=Prochlorococcus TaxID=1218 RepID=UPI000533B1D6|nr:MULTISPECIES: phosphoribosyltransferase [Prochlorococcus]KGG14168.1 putative PURINE PHOSPHORIBOSYLTRANSFERASE related protein [Prochlorococcus sp. MIT 0601]